MLLNAEKGLLWEFIFFIIRICRTKIKLYAINPITNRNPHMFILTIKHIAEHITSIKGIKLFLNKYFKNLDMPTTPNKVYDLYLID